VQEAFIRAYGALGRFRAGAPLRPWLLRIVANEAINRRRRARRVGLVELNQAAEARADAADPGPEGIAVVREQRAELLAAINQLRIEDRLVIAYRFWFDMPEAEMADALGCPRGTVKSRLSRAMGRLR